MPNNAESGYRGLLQVNVVNIQNNFPIQNARITISYKGDPQSPVEQVVTNSSGQTEQVALSAPPLELSLEPGDVQPYSEYNLRVEAEGFDPLVVSGTEILADSTAIQPVSMTPVGEVPPPEDPVVIPDHTLYGNYPPKIAEPEIKPVAESGEIVLSRVVVPQTVVVHDGVPTDRTAKDYYVPYRDYIKNVASSEIYSTWPRATITANVLAIMSFTLNRVYTEWYRNQGYDFTITSSTAFDHKWIYGRNIFESISLVVDEIFDNYLSRPGVRQPILTQYCDGRQVQCPNWMTQWGSCDLGQRGYSPIEILRYFYGDSIYVNTAEQISGIPASWPGYDLTVGSSGPKVQQMQEQLDTIATVYSAIPRVNPDGIYGERTAEAVREFQSIFGLPQTGVVNFATWYKISHIYVGITRIAELV
ncbi:peptidoglycan-binding protein [Enterocloster asparagiformis]|uniref:Peptidoglycan-binding protein n=2 Tax=Enterocloster asparagiformis TaxID=333367 RepID=A0A413FAR7_9FIRM|nr:peptidoglycan-binding protein [Enterocloster asparagiformis]EEG56275.1 putative peptidoglycan binding domain protein [[Clostridium] asparagiforme DSM 15981]RGX25979.1 peptidoglycan-binding protein [Enterocloster asparagiformis]UWO75478.1 peptidoglycan-binding protein [[Clostridium] asparagiforme DSM 15981]